MTIGCLVLGFFNRLIFVFQALPSPSYRMATITQPPNTSELLSHHYLKTVANLPLCFIVNYKTIRLSSLGCCELMITWLLSHKSFVQN